MALAPGTRLGAYEIVALLGAGGMGEVYRARDTKLGRDVALKILPALFAADPDRLARFRREAQVLASLNHQNIAQINGLEDSSDIPALAMELVEGPTLADRIAKGQIPLDEALPIARRIAEALEAAHEAGIIHRDLKPANIAVTSDGNVKVLDFGLAKAIEPASGAAIDLASSPTITSPAMMTGVGMILGTAAYMSPEQAKGRPADKRSDLWAFGCVFYEMLTGTRPFAGADVTETIAAVVRAEPNWSTLPADTPAAIRRLLRRCLEKDRLRRLPDAAVARLEIDDALTVPDAAVSGNPVGRRQTMTLVAWLVAAVAVTAAVTVAMSPVRRVASDSVPFRFEIATPPTTESASFALSPDGRQLVFVATGQRGSQLWLRSLDEVTAQPLAETEGASQPFWAPDSRSLGFFADGQLKRLHLGAGRPQVLAEARNPAGGAWNLYGDIIFSPNQASPLMRVAATGGTTTVVARLAPGERSHRFPVFLPDGRRFLVLFALSGPETEGIYLTSLDSPETRRRLLPDVSPVGYAPPGYLLLVRQGVLMAAPFNAARGTLLGEPTAVAPGKDSYNGVQFFSVSASGLLAYRTRGPVSSSRLTWIDRNGRETSGLSPSGFPHLSPDGQHVPVARYMTHNFDIWLFDAARSVARPLTFDPSI